MRNSLIKQAILFLSMVGGLAYGQMVNPVVSTAPTNGNADDPAIWIHPTDLTRSVIIGTDKDAGIYVWNMDGEELQHLEQGTTCNNVDVRYRIQLDGQLTDIVATNLRDAGKLAVFKVNPNSTNGEVLTQIAGESSENNDIQGNSYGFALYRRPADGTLYVFEYPETGGAVRQYRIQDDGTGNGIALNAVRDLNYDGGQAEGFVADDELGFIYVTEEAGGIHKFYADPEASVDRISLFATGDGTADDREGVAIYACGNGTGYLVLSSQGNSTIKIYERQGNNRFIKTIVATNEDGNEGLGSDGLDVTSAAAANFPQGFVVVHDQDGSKFHLYNWLDFAQSDMTICVNGAPNTAVADDGFGVLPGQFELAQNYPNPFNPSTTIFFELPKASEVTLSIYTIQGQLVRTLISGKVAAGRHQASWDGTNYKNVRVASGLYVYRLETPGFVASKELVLTR
ncbi:MAG: phytase [bacterium]